VGPTLSPRSSSILLFYLLHPFATRFVERSNSPVALVNYSLTTPSTASVVHPMHARDVLDAINFILSDPSLQDAFDHSTIHIAGHSCGAHIVTSIFLDSSFLSPSQSLISAVKSISLSEGLYDLDLLLSTWPDYRSYVQPAFGDHLDFRKFSTVHYPLRDHSHHIRWFIIHSTGDKLVDLPQSMSIYQHLLDLGTDVSKDWTSLNGNHDEILTTETYPNIIAQHTSKKEHV